MMVVGFIASEEETTELASIVKIILVGQRIQKLAQEARRKNENNNTKKNK